MDLHQFFTQYNKLAVFYTGDVCSSYLLWGCLSGMVKAKPYFVKTPAVSEEHMEYALTLTRAFGFEAEVIETEDDGLHSLELVKAAAEKAGYCDIAVAFGTDREENDPLIRKAKELGYLMPYRLCGLDEKEVCRKARNAGFSIGNMWESESHDEDC